MKVTRLPDGRSLVETGDRMYVVESPDKLFAPPVLPVAPPYAETDLKASFLDWRARERSASLWGLDAPRTTFTPAPDPLLRRAPTNPREAWAWIREVVRFGWLASSGDVPPVRHVTPGRRSSYAIIANVS